MSAKVAIEIGGEKVIMIPINAVYQQHGQTYVRVVDDKTKKISEVAVKTGATTLDEVTIEANLYEGEKVVVSG